MAPRPRRHREVDAGDGSEGVAAVPYRIPLVTLRTACMIAIAMKPTTAATAKIMIGSSAVVKTRMFFSSWLS